MFDYTIGPSRPSLSRSAGAEDEELGCKDNIHDVGYNADNTICSFVPI
jgi:hypothetical protein